MIRADAQRTHKVEHLCAAAHQPQFKLTTKHSPRGTAQLTVEVVSLQVIVGDAICTAGDTGAVTTVD